MGLRCACSDKDCMDCIFLLDCGMYRRLMALTRSLDYYRVGYSDVLKENDD